MNLESTIAAAATIHRQIADLKTQLAPFEEVIARHALEFATEDDRGIIRAELPGARVVFPRPSLKLTDENWAEARQSPAWPKISEKIKIPFRLVKNARDLIGALLAKRDAAKLIDLLEGDPATPRITYT